MVLVSSPGSSSAHSAGSSPEGAQSPNKHNAQSPSPARDQQHTASPNPIASTSTVLLGNLDQARVIKRRRGKKITLLRDKYAINKDKGKSSSSDVTCTCSGLSPSSTVAGMAALELRSALSYSLTSLALDHINSSPFPCWFDLNAALRRLGHRLNSPDQTLASVTSACLVAIGSRLSDHSAITGSSSYNRNSRQSSALGQQRESACRTLATRAVQGAHEAGVFTNASQNNVETIALVRSMLMIVQPRHSFLNELVPHLKAQYTNGIIALAAEGLVAADATTSILHRRPLVVREAELPGLGWPILDIPKVQQNMTAFSHGSPLEYSQIHEMQGFIVHVLRLLSQLLSTGWSATKPRSLPLPAGPVFANLFKLIDVIQDALVALQPDPHSGQLPYPRWHDKPRILMKLPLLLNTGATTLAKDLLATGLDPRAPELVRQAEVRYLSWMGRFIEAVAWTGEAGEDRHGQALLIETLEISADWLGLAVKGAQDHARGEGAYAEAGLSWADLRKLHGALDTSSATFGTHAARQEELAAALAEAERTGSVAVAAPEKEAAAELMVAQALFELVC